MDGGDDAPFHSARYAVQNPPSPRHSSHFTHTSAFENRVRSGRRSAMRATHSSSCAASIATMCRLFRANESAMPRRVQTTTRSIRASNRRADVTCSVAFASFASRARARCGRAVSCGGRRGARRRINLTEKTGERESCTPGPSVVLRKQYESTRDG